MKLRHVIEKSEPNGAIDRLVNDIEKAEIVLGRGPASDVLIDSRFVSLVQAKLFEKDGRLWVEDAGSLGGTQVNDTLIRQHALNSGDKIGVGDVEYIVGKDGALWTLTEKREVGAHEDTEAKVDRSLRQLSLSHRLPSPLTLSLICSGIILVVFLLIPLGTDVKSSWSSGPIANVHHTIGHDCHSCHGAPFERVKDDKCLACHNMTAHAQTIADKTVSEPSCAGCHMDHNAVHGLIARESKLCVDCHGDLKSKLGETKIPSIRSFASHPEFAVELMEINAAASKKVSLDDAKNLIDPTPIKLNHKIHLEPNLRGATGPVTLQCQDCHKLSSDFRTIEPISMEKNCRTCHSLEFDERLVGNQVPHGEPDLVYSYLYAQYAKLLLESQAGMGLDAGAPVRIRPGSSAEAAKTKEEFTRAWVETEARNAEDLLFTRTACDLCHQVTEEPISPADPNAGSKSRYRILEPNIPTRWMPNSIFSHGAHEMMRCQDCHAGVPDSTKTSEVLLPKIKECRSCHTDEAGHATVQSDCVLCHSYHEPLPVAPDKKRSSSQFKSKG